MSPWDKAGLLKVGFQGFEQVGIRDFFPIRPGEAEGVDGGTFFGVDPGSSVVPGGLHVHPVWPMALRAQGGGLPHRLVHGL